MTVRFRTYIDEREVVLDILSLLLYHLYILSEHDLPNLAVFFSLMPPTTAVLVKSGLSFLLVMLFLECRVAILARSP